MHRPGRGGSSSSTGPLPYRKEVAVLVLAITAAGLMSYSRHCGWVTREAYSSPSIVLISGWGPYRVVLDDFREAYYWLRQNTAPDARIMSWWDYGYQITGMANRCGVCGVGRRGVGWGAAGGCRGLCKGVGGDQADHSQPACQPRCIALRCM